MSPEEFTEWLRDHIAAAETMGLADHHIAGSLTCARRPRLGRRVGDGDGGAVYLFTLGELRVMLERVERMLEARGPAAEEAA